MCYAQILSPQPNLRVQSLGFRTRPVKPSSKLTGTVCALMDGHFNSAHAFPRRALLTGRVGSVQVFYEVYEKWGVEGFPFFFEWL